MKNTPALLAGYWTLAGNRFPDYGDPASEISEFPFRDRMEMAAQAGFNGVGLLHSDLQNAVEEHGLAEIQAILRHNGLEYIELEFLGDWFAEGARRTLSDQFRKDFLDMAAALSARDLKIAPDMNVPGCDMSRMVDTFATLCEQAADVDLLIALEIMPFGNIDTLDKGLELVSAAKQNNGGLLLDAWHVVRGGIRYSDIATMPARYIKSVELCDAAAHCEGTLWNDTIHRRRLCGEGDFDLDGFLDALDQAGYRGPYSLEVISARHRTKPLTEAATSAYHTTQALFERRRAQSTGE